MSNEDEGEGEGNGGGRPGVEFGAYVALILDDEGKVAERLEIVTETKFPSIGEALDVLRDDGTSTGYRVEDIRHPEKESPYFQQYRYTGLVAVLRKDTRSRPDAGPGGSPRRDQTTTTPATPKATTAVLDFRAKLPDPRSRMVNLTKLLACVVAVGYREQRLLFEALKNLAWQLRWDGRRWLMQQITCERSPEELRELSRAAKRAGLDAERYLEHVLAMPATAESELADVISLDSYRR